MSTLPSAPAAYEQSTLQKILGQIEQALAGAVSSAGAYTWKRTQTFAVPPVLPVYTVATLPTAGTAGRRAMVTDANATTFASVVAAGGANKVPVYDDGTNWRIG